MKILKKTLALSLSALSIIFISSVSPAQAAVKNNRIPIYTPTVPVASISASTTRTYSSLEDVPEKIYCRKTAYNGYEHVGYLYLKSVTTNEDGKYVSKYSGNLSLSTLPIM